MHNGHKYLINKAAENGPVCLIMSGNFTQRGSAAIFDKYTRAELAAVCGADLVLELPYPWCSAGAADFARAGVSLAHFLGAERLLFGSGCGDGELLERAGNAFADTDFDEAFLNASRESPLDGAARIRERLLSEIFTSDELALLSNPNDILGVEYYRYSRLFGGIKCVPVKRISGDGIVSATELRRIASEEGIMKISGFVPAEAMTDAVLSGLLPASEHRLYDIERTLLRMDACDVDCCAESEGGLGRRLRCAAGKSVSGAEMFELAATKKYTASRIRRAALYCALGTKRAYIKKAPLYTTILAMRETGKEVLRNIKNRCEIELLTKAGDCKKLSPEAAGQFEHCAAADRLYTMLMPQAPPEDYFLTVTPWVEGRNRASRYD